MQYLFWEENKHASIDFPKWYKTKRLYFQSLVHCLGSMKLFHPRYLCFVSWMPLPHIAKCSCCKWLMKTGCWISSWLTGLCGQHCVWKWSTTAWATPVHWNNSLSYRHGRKGALHPPLRSKDTTINRGGKSDRLIPYKLGIANLSSTLPFCTMCLAFRPALKVSNSTLLAEQRPVHPDLSRLFSAHLSKQTLSQQSMTIQNHISVWKCESQLQDIALPHLMFHLRH